MAQLPQSNLEFAHNIREPSLYAYMNVLEPGSYVTPPLELIKIASDLSRHPHPLVRHAAGWAATEAGTINHRRAAQSRWTMQHREEALTIGETIWRSIDDDEWATFAEPTDYQRQADLWSFSLRNRIATMYMPALRLAARSRARQPLATEDIYPQLQRVKHGLMPLVRTLILEPDDRSRKAHAMQGLAGEVSAAWLLQGEFLQATPPSDDAPSPKYIVTPASLREDHHRRPADRHDLNVHALTGKRKKTPVQVSGSAKDAPPNAFEVVMRQYMGDATQTMQGFLRRIYEHETGSQTTGTHLTEISSKLCADMARYEIERRQANKE